VLNFLLIIFFFFSLRSEVHTEVLEQVKKWHNIQQQLAILYSQHAQMNGDKTHDKQEFFNIQQQLGAIYLAQKRYQLGFGTAFLPSEKAVYNYVRKKTFLALKTKELVPLYTKYAQEYQKKYASGNFERIQKQIKQLEALNVLHVKLFEQNCQSHGLKYWTDTSKISEISSIQHCVKKLPVGPANNKSNHLLNWITPVAGIREDPLKTIWAPLAGAIVLCPDSGTISSIGLLGGSIVVFIKQQHFTYVLTGLSKCLANTGDKLTQGEPLGFCAEENPCLVELQLWHDDVTLDPEPYHKIVQL
jgi:hypothetical protein